MLEDREPRVKMEVHVHVYNIITHIIIIYSSVFSLL